MMRRTRPLEPMSGCAGQRLVPMKGQWRRSPPWLSFLVRRSKGRTQGTSSRKRHPCERRAGDQNDQQLLRDYAASWSEAAFAELVRRNVDLVYSAAIRMVRDPHQAEERGRCGVSPGYRDIRD